MRKGRVVQRVSLTAALAAVAGLISSPNFAADPRIVVVSPSPNTIVRPGDKLRVRVDVDSSVQASEVAVWNNAGARLPSVYLRTPPYETDLAIHFDWTGPLRLMILVKTISDGVLEGPEVTLKVIPDVAPARISVLDANKFFRLPHNSGHPLPDNTDARRIRVSGHYLDNQGKEIRRDLSGSQFGTTYTSSNPAITTVDAEGIVTPVAPGIAFITVENKGIKAYCEIDVEPLVGALPPIDQTSKISFQGGGFLLDRTTNQYVQQVKITNQSTLPIPKPLDLILTGLPSGVMLAKESGFTKIVTPLDSPYVHAGVFDGTFLLPGQSVSLQLRFINNTKQPITYTPKLYTGNRL